MTVVEHLKVRISRLGVMLASASTSKPHAAAIIALIHGIQEAIDEAETDARKVD